MKRIFFLVFACLLCVSSAVTQTKPKKPKTIQSETKKPTTIVGVGMVFESETIDYGTVQQYSNGKREFVFQNNGTLPLIIESTKGTCGCTVPSKPEQPILPGEKGIIEVSYDTKIPGPFTKNITVKSNATGQEVKILGIKGSVKEIKKPASSGPVKS